MDRRGRGGHGEKAQKGNGARKFDKEGRVPLLVHHLQSKFSYILKNYNQGAGCKGEAETIMLRS